MSGAGGRHRDHDHDLDYRGVEVLASYAPLDIEGVDWVILSEIDADEAFASIRVFARNHPRLAGLCWPLLVLGRRGCCPAVLWSRSSSSRTPRGDSPPAMTDVEVPVSSGDDELGRLTATFNQMVSAIRQKTADLRKTAEELEGISSVILRWGPDGRIRFMNDFGLQLFGFSEDELVGRPLLGTIVPTPTRRRRTSGP